jgi:hypothetical protein
VGFPVDESIRYDTNPSIRGVHVNKLLLEAKSKGFVYDDEHNNVGFRSEFIFYYLDNFEKLHYGSAAPTELTSEDEQEEPVLKCGKNIILYGVPGCGKSHEIKTNYCNNSKYMTRVVFHPDYTYSDFVGQILPKTDGKVLHPIKVLRADIDYNKHLNNANYVRMAMELLPENFVVNGLRVEYRVAAKLGDCLIPTIYKIADGIIVSLSIGSEVSAIIEFT